MVTGRLRVRRLATLLLFAAATVVSVGVVAWQVQRVYDQITISD